MHRQNHGHHVPRERSSKNWMAPNVGHEQISGKPGEEDARMVLKIWNGKRISDVAETAVKINNHGKTHIDIYL